MKPLRPGTVVTFEYPIRDLHRTIRGVVLEPSEYTLPGEVRVQWYDGYGVTNIARKRITAEEQPR